MCSQEIQPYFTSIQEKEEEAQRTVFAKSHHFFGQCLHFRIRVFSRIPKNLKKKGKMTVLLHFSVTLIHAFHALDKSAR
jgi:hypothetical protein